MNETFEQCRKNLLRRGFEVRIAATTEEARQILREEIRAAAPETICFGAAARISSHRICRASSVVAAIRASNPRRTRFRRQRSNVSFMAALFDEESVNVVSVGIDQQRQNNHQADVLGHLEELFARLAARDDLPQGEQGVSAVQSRDREQVHHREDDGQEGGLEPEVMPVPATGEDAADSHESAQFLVHFGFGLHDQLQLVPVARNRLSGLVDACRDGLPECVILCSKRIGIRDRHADPSFGIDGQCERIDERTVAADGQQNLVVLVILQVVAVSGVVRIAQIVDRLENFIKDFKIHFNRERFFDRPNGI